MPWTVNECGRRGAIGPGREFFVFIGSVTVTKLLVRISGSGRRPHAISVRFSGLPEGPPSRQTPARLVDRQVVWLGFLARPSRTYAVQLLPVHFFVPADRLVRLFRARPAERSGARDMAGAGVAGILRREQLAVRSAVICVARVHLSRRPAFHFRGHERRPPLCAPHITLPPHFS